MKLYFVPLQVFAQKRQAVVLMPLPVFAQNKHAIQSQFTNKDFLNETPMSHGEGASDVFKYVIPIFKIGKVGKVAVSTFAKEAAKTSSKIFEAFAGVSNQSE